MSKEIKSMTQAIIESTCLKRIVICELYNEDNELIARESNRCNPENGICQRLNVQPNPESPKECSCNWTHAEMMALKSIDLTQDTPFIAVIYNYPFSCNNCKEALIEAGIQQIIAHDTLPIDIHED